MNADDPKLTAYALDELDPADRAELEQLLRDDPSAFAEIEETRAFAATLRQHLAAEPAAPLTDAQRACILAVVAGIADPGGARPARELVLNARPPAGISDPGYSRVVPFWKHPAVLTALAASVAVLATLALLTPAINRHYTALRQPTAVPVRENPEGFKIAMAPAPAEPPSLAPAPDGNAVAFTPEQPTPNALAVTALASSTSVPNPTAFSLAPAPMPTVKAIGDLSSTAMPGNLPGLTPRGVPATMAGRVGGIARPARSKDWSGQVAAVPGRGRPTDYAFDTMHVDEMGRSTVIGRHYTVLRDEPEPKTDTASYEALADNPFTRVGDAPLSTFSIDVDTASYANVRRFLNENTLPPRDAVRIEELVNYFHYDYPAPADGEPFSSSMEVASCPWSPEHRLVRIGLKGREIQRADRAASNLVFLIDVSGSMQPAERLPLLKRSMALLVDQLTERDRVAIVVYAGSSGCVLDSTHDKRAVRDALDRLESGGSTNGASGIQLAYEIAQKHFIKGGTNRVILATDGDFNVGMTDQDDLVRLIQKKAKSGVFLTCLGFGTENLKDSTLEKLADQGNGNYAYLDTLTEGRRVLVEQMAGTLITIAKDVKIQVEFNPAKVSSYRLIGYENRLLKKEDFNDDTKDAGEIGSGHHVTALYEIVPVGQEGKSAPATDTLKYQPAAKPAPEPIREPLAGASPELLTLKLRFKKPDGDTSVLREFPLTDPGADREKCSRDFRFAAAVASFGMILRDSPHRGNATFDSVLSLTAEGKGEDRDGYRAEFVGLVEKAKALAL